MKRVNFGRVALFSLASLWLANGYAADDYQQWLKGQRQEFTSYLEEVDREFGDYLKKQWQEFQTYSGVVRDETPKPRKLPVAPKPVKPKPVIEKPPVIAPIIVPEIPKPAPPPKVVKDKETLVINFYGTEVGLNVPDEVRRVAFSRPANKDKIAEFWVDLGKLDTQKLQQSLKQAIKQLQLNDWGVVQLTYQLGKKLYRDNERRILLSWFLLSKSGYNVKLGHDGRTVFLLVPSSQMIYETPYLTIDGKRHYVYHFDDAPLSKSLYTYEGNYPKANVSLSLQLSQAPNLTGIMEERHLAFEYEGKKYTVDVPVNKGMVDFLNSYPQSDLDIYFSAAASPETAKAMLEALRVHLKGRDLTDAINFLLRFAQTGFAYKTDQQQFGEENYLFLDETLHYSASDCEDRSVLFAWLVKNLLGLEVVGLSYPGHVATAILLEPSVKGDSVSFKGKRYVVADPTYINANLGMAMPQFKGVNPEVVPVVFN